MGLEAKANTYISPKEAAARLSVSTGTIRRLIKDNKLEAYRFGNQIRIVSESVARYIDRQKITI